jgi:peptidoglycan/LPS O-acetylase OafA/YrhL
LLQSWTWTSDYVFSFNGVSWFLSSLVFCYLLAPTLAKRLRRVSPLRAPFYALGLATLLFAVASWYNSAIGFATLCFTDVFPPYRFGQFAIGGFVAVAYRGIAKTGRIPRSNLVQVGAFVLFLAVYFLCSGHIDHPIPAFGFLILETMLMFAACCVDGGLSDAGSTRVIRFLSGCSLPFFLIHARVLQIYRLYVGEPGDPSIATVATFIGLLAFAVVISYAYMRADGAVRRAWRARRAGAAS